MIADIFYPIFTLTITILACSTRKKVKLFRGFSPTRSPRHHPRPPGGGIQLPPRAPASIGFGFAKNRCTHIFSALSSEEMHKLKITNTWQRCQLFEIKCGWNTNSPLLSGPTSWCRRVFGSPKGVKGEKPWKLMLFGP